MLTSDQNRKINEIVEEFKEAGLIFTVWSIPKTLWGCFGILDVCCF